MIIGIIVFIVFFIIGRNVAYTKELEEALKERTKLLEESLDQFEQMSNLATEQKEMIDEYEKMLKNLMNLKK